MASFAWDRAWAKISKVSFLSDNEFSNNFNTITNFLITFPKHVGICESERKFNEYSGETKENLRKLLKVCILEVNPE